MDKLIELSGHRVALRYKRVKNINMRVQPNGLVAVSAPRHVPLRDIAAFVAEKSDWITTNAAKLAARGHKALSYQAGSLHLLWGEEYPLHIHAVRRGQKAEFESDGWHLSSRSDASDDKKAALMEGAYQHLLLDKARPLMAQWADKMGVHPKQLKTQHMRSQWGSCHVSRGVIKLNSELARKPEAMLEYVLVHELVHLFERGHNARFYAYMDKYLPDWKTRKRQLNGISR